MHLEIMVEEPSAEEALSLLIPKIIGTKATFAIHITALATSRRCCAKSVLASRRMHNGCQPTGGSWYSSIVMTTTAKNSRLDSKRLQRTPS